MLPHSGNDDQDKAQQIGSDVVEAGRGDTMKTIRAIRALLEKLGSKVEIEGTQPGNLKCCWTRRPCPQSEQTGGRRHRIA